MENRIHAWSPVKKEESMTGMFRSALHRWTKPKIQPLEDDVREEAESIERDLLTKELDVIERQHRLNAQRAKYEFLASWMAARARQVPRSGGGHGAALGSSDAAIDWLSRTGVVRSSGSAADRDSGTDRPSRSGSDEGGEPKL